jgi:hypothetical protein
MYVHSIHSLSSIAIHGLCDVNNQYSNIADALDLAMWTTFIQTMEARAEWEAAYNTTIGWGIGWNSVTQTMIMDPRPPIGSQDDLTNVPAIITDYLPVTTMQPIDQRSVVGYILHTLLPLPFSLPLCLFVHPEADDVK